MAYEHQLDPARLFEAVDAVIEACHEVTDRGEPLPFPTRLLGDPDQPACLCDFTRDEVDEACAFLVRMRILEPETGSKDANKN